MTEIPRIAVVIAAWFSSIERSASRMPANYSFEGHHPTEGHRRGVPRESLQSQLVTPLTQRDLSPTNGRSAAR
jgi:hypothetical protein